MPVVADVHHHQAPPLPVTHIMTSLSVLRDSVEGDYRILVLLLHCNLQTILLLYVRNHLLPTVMSFNGILGIKCLL